MDESKAAGGDPRLRAKIREAFDLFDKEKHGTVIQEYVGRRHSKHAHASPDACMWQWPAPHTGGCVPDAGTERRERRVCGASTLRADSHVFAPQGGAYHHAIPGRVPQREGRGGENPARRA